MLQSNCKINVKEGRKKGVIYKGRKLTPVPDSAREKRRIFLHGTRCAACRDYTGKQPFTYSYLDDDFQTRYVGFCWLCSAELVIDPELLEENAPPLEKSVIRKPTRPFNIPFKREYIRSRTDSSREYWWNK